MKLASFLALIGVLSVSGTALAANPILDDLRQQGAQAQPLNDEALDKIKGAALIYGQPMPSVTVGLKEHSITYKGWGSYNDYSSYNYIGYGYNPSNKYTFTHTDGGTYRVAGDQWLADLVSAPNSWSAANAVLIEYHYQVLDPNTYAPTAWGFRETAWNRPISTFHW